MRDAITDALQEAQKDDDTNRLSTLRLIKATINDRDSANRAAGRDPVSDEDVLQILMVMRRQRVHSAREFEESGRIELAEQELAEIAVIDEFLPEQLDQGAMVEACREAVSETDAKGLRDVGRCMNKLKERFPGQMDFAKASTVVKGMLR